MQKRQAILVCIAWLRRPEHLPRGQQGQRGEVAIRETWDQIWALHEASCVILDR